MDSKQSTKDLPKLSMQLPDETVWTVTVRDGVAYATAHPRSQPNYILMTGVLREPENVIRLLKEHFSE